VTAARRLALLACLGTSLLAGCSIVARKPPPPPPEVVLPPPSSVESVPDAIPRREPRSAHGNPPFYNVLGKRYVVLATEDGYLERGVASWYGPTFHGENTSSGEKYDMFAMTAAHKTLPLPCYARVTNLKNGRSVVVRINDRGPFVANRLIDLSYSAAAKLDMLKEGTTLVEVRAISLNEPDQLTRTAQTPPATLYVQIGAFADQRNAQRVLDRLHVGGLPRAFIYSPPEATPTATRTAASTPLYRVRLGPISTVPEFDELAARLKALGFSDALLTTD
jgi:rare lipoprotein A